MENFLVGSPFSFVDNDTYDFVNECCLRMLF